MFSADVAGVLTAITLVAHNSRVTEEWIDEAANNLIGVIINVGELIADQQFGFRHDLVVTFDMKAILDSVEGAGQAGAEQNTQAIPEKSLTGPAIVIVVEGIVVTGG